MDSDAHSIMASLVVFASAESSVLLAWSVLGHFGPLFLLLDDGAFSAAVIAMSNPTKYEFGRTHDGHLAYGSDRGP